MDDIPADLPSLLGLDLERLRTPRCLFQVELDLFRITEMARVWLEENQIAPYKLALLAGVSTSQTHRTLHDDWRPSRRLLERVTRALPEDWVAAFERDCDLVLPNSMHHMAGSQTMHRLAEVQSKAAASPTSGAFQDYLKDHGFSFTIVDRSDGRLGYRALHTADPRLEQMARERGYITPFFRPLIRQHQGMDQTNVAILRHPLILGEECFTSTYWLLQIQAFGASFSIADRMAFAPVSNARQAHIVKRFYDVFIPALIGRDAD